MENKNAGGGQSPLQTGSSPFKLDYSIESPQQRTELVKKIIDQMPPEKLTNKYLQIFANYIIFAMTKKEKKQKKINTDNRMVTINKRETSYEGLAMKFENGEDGLYNIISDNNKNVIFTPKIGITEKDLQVIPGLRELRDAIKVLEQQQKTAKGKRKYLLKKQIIQMRQDQYILKNSYYHPIYCLNAVKNFSNIRLDDKISLSQDNQIIDSSLLSFFNPRHVSALLCNYSKLKQEAYGKFYTDSYYLMQDLDNLIEETLKEKYPLYLDLLIYKIDGKQNAEIQELLNKKYNIKHSIEYISSLWRNKIPKMIANQAEIKYLEWYFLNKEYGKWKKCSRCGQIKLAHNKFFSKNTSSKDGFYSICKQCRNTKVKSKYPKIIKRIPYKKEG